MSPAKAAITALFLLAACGSAPAQGPDQRPALIPLDLSGPRPTAKLSLGGGAPVTAIFDSGAAASVVMIGFARAIGLPDEGKANASGPGGVPVEGFRTSIAGTLGAARFGPALAVALDLPMPLPGVSAVISPSVFAGRLVRFDFKAGNAKVLASNASNLPREPGLPYSGGGFSLMTVSRVPTALLGLPGGRTIVADVDTGYDGGIELPLALAGSLPLHGPLVPGRPARMVGLTRPTFNARLNGRLSIGPIALADPDLTFVDGGSAPAKVGMRVLKDMVLVLDPGNSRSWIVKA